MRLRIILLGQLLSVLNAASQLFSEVLNKRLLVDLSGIQPLIAYIGIFLVSCPFFFFLRRKSTCSEKGKDGETLASCEDRLMGVCSPHMSALNRTDIWKHLAAALLDCSATFLVVRSFRHLSIFHVVLLLSLSTPFSMIFSALLLKRRFSMLQAFGAALSLVAVSAFILFPMKGIYEHQNPRPVNTGSLTMKAENESGSWEYTLGLAMGASSAALYALSNIAQELLIRRNGILSFLFCLGLFGTIASLGLCLLIIENPIGLLRSLFEEPNGEGEGIASFLCLMGFGVSLLLFYCINPLFLRAYGATTFNLSLLTSIIYSSGGTALWWWLGWRSADTEFNGMGAFLIQYAMVLVAVLLGQYLFLRKDCKQNLMNAGRVFDTS
ncbi:hypothetical protein MDAP_002827 [Mitosporidium daphniae]